VSLIRDVLNNNASMAWLYPLDRDKTVSYCHVILRVKLRTHFHDKEYQHQDTEGKETVCIPLNIVFISSS